MNICAGIVLYNPEIERLKQNVEAILPQVDFIIFADNASINADELHTIFDNDKIKWINNDKNNGVAGALNQLVKYADDSGYKWILTLDQDSVCDTSLVGELKAAIGKYDNVAMSSPRVIDRKLDLPEDSAQTPRETTAQRETTVQRETEPLLPAIESIDMCITSGCLTNVKAVLEAGGFNERLFIDQVDHDMCLRLKRQGYTLLRVNSTVLIQEFGQKAVRRRFLWKTVLYHHHSPYRVYYQTRNMLFMVRKYGLEFTQHPRLYYWRLFVSFFIKFIYEPQRFSRLAAFIRGYIAGLFIKID